MDTSGVYVTREAAEEWLRRVENLVVIMPGEIETAQQLLALRALGLVEYVAEIGWRKLEEH